MPFDLMPVTKPGVFTIDGLIEWLEGQPGDKKYSYFDICACLCHDYLCDVTGTDRPWNLPLPPNNHGGRYSSIFPSIDAYHYVAGTEPYTLGAALTRARALRGG